MPRTDVLVMGGSGFIGGRVVQAAQAAGLRAACTHYQRPTPKGAEAYRLEINDAAALAACLAETHPAAVVYSVVSGQFDSNLPEAHLHTSVGGLRALLDALRVVGIRPRLVYVSTNAVFSGQDGPYAEQAQPDPDVRQDNYRWYGLARRIGEELTLSQWPDALVARTANVDGRDFTGQQNPRLRRLLDALFAGQPVARFVDRTISPTLVDSLAEALVEISRPEFVLPPGRVLHLAGSEALSDYAYARQITQFLGLPADLVREDHYLAPGSPGRYNIALANGWTQSLLRTPLPGAADMIARMMDDPHWIG